MIRRVAAALFVVAVACTPAPRPRDSSGHPVSVDLRGAPLTLLHFWASWCVPCREELPRFVTFAAAHHARVIAVSQDGDYASAERFLRQHAIAMSTLLDDRGRFAASHHVRVIPTTIAFNAEGHVIERFDQSVDWGDPAIARRLFR